MDKKRPYKVTRHQEYEIGRFTIVKDTIEIDGTKYPYSYEKVEDCVCILPIIGDSIVLLRQYRHSFNQWFYELPAGGIGDGKPEFAARRELLEETGYLPERMEYLGKCPVSQGTSTAVAYLYAAVCGQKRGQELDKTEMIEVMEVPKAKFIEMIKNLEFDHMVGIAAWHLYQQQFKEK